MLFQHFSEHTIINFSQGSSLLCLRVSKLYLQNTLLTEELLLSLCYSQLKRRVPMTCLLRAPRTSEGLTAQLSLTWLQLGAFKASINPSPIIMVWKLEIREPANLNMLSSRYPPPNILKGERDFGSAEQPEETALLLQASI